MAFALRKHRRVGYAGLGMRGLGMTVHGVELQDCTAFGDNMAAALACSSANQAAVNASYGEHTGSYLGGGVYAGTPEAYARYGDPTYKSFTDQYQQICGGSTCHYDVLGNIINPAAQVTAPKAPVASPVVTPSATVAVAPVAAPSAPAGNGSSTPIPALHTSLYPASVGSWFTGSMFGGIPNWVLLAGAGVAAYSFAGRGRR